MLLTIHNLPPHTEYPDVKELIISKCGLRESILDNLQNEGNGMRVTVGVMADEDAAILVRKVNGIYFRGYQLYVENKKHTEESDQPYRRTTGQPSKLAMVPEQPGYDCNTLQSMGMYQPNVQMSNYAMYTPMPVAQTVQNTFMAYGEQSQTGAQAFVPQYGAFDYTQQAFIPLVKQNPEPVQQYARKEAPVQGRVVQGERWGEGDVRRSGSPKWTSRARTGVAEPEPEYCESRGWSDQTRLSGGFERSKDVRPPRMDEHMFPADNVIREPRVRVSRGGHVRVRPDLPARTRDDHPRDVNAQKRRWEDSNEQPDMQNEWREPEISPRPSRSLQREYRAPRQGKFKLPAEPRANQFTPPQEKFAPRPEKFAQRQEKFEPPQEKFARRSNQFAPPQEKFETRPNQFAPPHKKFETRPNQFAPPHKKFAPEKFAPRPSRFEPLPQKFPKPEQKFAPRPTKFAPPTNKLQSRPNKFAPPSNNFQPRSNQFQPQLNKFESPPSKFAQGSDDETNNLLKSFTFSKVKGVGVIMFEIGKNLNIIEEYAGPSLMKSELRRKIDSRVLEIMGEETLPPDVILNRYRQLYPESDDAKLYSEVERKITENVKPFKKSIKNRKLGQNVPAHLKPKKEQTDDFPKKKIPSKVIRSPEEQQKLQAKKNKKRPFDVDADTKKAIDKEVEPLMTLIKKQFKNPPTSYEAAVYKVINQHLCIFDCKKYLCEHIAKRITNTGDKLATVHGRPELPPRRVLVEYLLDFGCVALAKSSKQSYFMATFDSFETVDKLCSMGPIPLENGEVEIYFKHVPIYVKKPKYSQVHGKSMRKKYVKSLIEKSPINLLSEDWQNVEKEEKKKVQADLKKWDEEIFGNSNTVAKVDLTSDDVETKPLKAVKKSQIISKKNNDFLHEDFEVIDEVRESEDENDPAIFDKTNDGDGWIETGEDWGDVENIAAKNDNTVDDNAVGDNDAVEDDTAIEDEQGEESEDGDENVEDFGDIDLEDLDENDLEDY